MLKKFFIASFLVVFSSNSLSQVPERKSLRSKDTELISIDGKEETLNEVCKRNSNDWWRSPLFCVTPMRIVGFTAITCVLSAVALAIWTDLIPQAQRGQPN